MDGQLLLAPTTSTTEYEDAEIEPLCPGTLLGLGQGNTALGGGKHRTESDRRGTTTDLKENTKNTTNNL